jgi:hypothetical protein
MCTSNRPKAPAPAPVITQPVTQTEIIDDAAVDTRTRERRRRQQAAGFSSTLVTGSSGAGAPPTAGQKTLLGS